MNKSGILQFFGLNTWGKISNSFKHLLFPEQCLSCYSELATTDQALCGECKHQLPFTYFENYSEPSSMDQLFWGRVQVESTYALFYFEKGKSSQKILHDLKYKSNANVGGLFGKLIGEKILTNEKYNSIDLLLPVPIHPKKEFVRGYNQSVEIAKGISQALNIELDKKSLTKVQSTGSQTRKNRFARWDNVVNNFSVKKTSKSIKHIALVDDVVTTGSTLEALIKAIRQENPELKISIICLALAK